MEAQVPINLLFVYLTKSVKYLCGRSVTSGSLYIPDTYGTCPSVQINSVSPFHGLICSIRHTLKHFKVLTTGVSTFQGVGLEGVPLYPKTKEGTNSDRFVCNKDQLYNN